MDLTLWDSSFDQATQERNNHIIDGLENGCYFRYGPDVIEESVLNEKCCVQVLRKLITKADNEIVQLEEDLVILQSQLAWADEDWSQLCSIALREKIDCLDISIRSLKSETLKDEYDFGYSLQIHREPAERLHDILKVLLRHFSHQKDKQSGDVICQESSSDRQGQATKLLLEKKQTRNFASNTVRTLQVKDFSISYAEKHVNPKNNLKSPGKKTIFSGSTKVANTIPKGPILESSRLAASLINGKRTLSNINKERTIKVEPTEHALTPADLLVTQKSSLKTLMKQRNHTESLKYKPLAIVVPRSSSNGEKPAIRQSKEITPRDSTSEISIRKPTKKSSTTSVLTVEDKQKTSTAMVRHSFSSNATGCNGKKKLSNIASRITNEKEIVAQSCTERSIILVGKGTNTSVKPIDTTSTTSDSSKEATEDSGSTPKLVKEPAVTPENIDTSNSFSKEDSTTPRRVKVQEATASGTTHTAADSHLELLYNRRGNTTMPRSKRNQVQKAKELGPNSAPVSQKRRKIGSNSAVLEDIKVLAKLQDDEASNSMAENVKTLHSPTLLNDLTIIELRVIAKQRGMTGFYRLRKAELAITLGFKLNRGMRKGKGNEANVLRIMPGEQ